MDRTCNTYSITYIIWVDDFDPCIFLYQFLSPRVWQRLTWWTRKFEVTILQFQYGHFAGKPSWVWNFEWFQHVSTKKFFELPPGTPPNSNIEPKNMFGRSLSCWILGQKIGLIYHIPMKSTWNPHGKCMKSPWHFIPYHPTWAIPGCFRFSLRSWLWWQLGGVRVSPSMVARATSILKKGDHLVVHPTARKWVSSPQL